MTDRYKKLSATIDGYAADFGVNGVYAMYMKDETITESAYGFADAAKTRPMTLESRYCFTLVAKWIVNICLARLFDMKRARPSDRLDRWLPEYPYAAKISLLQLITNRAGVPDYETQVLRRRSDADPAVAAMTPEQRMVAEAAMTAAPPSTEELIAAIAPLPLEFEPGTDQQWGSWTNDALLAGVVERASGMSLFAFAKEAVFDPAGMTVSEGDEADTDASGRVNFGPAVPIPHTPVTRAYTTDGASVCRLVKALAAGGVLSENGWKFVLRHTSEPGAAAFGDNNGVLSFYSAGPFGYELCGYFSRKTGLAIAAPLREPQAARVVDSEQMFFRPYVRRAFEGVLQEYTAPKMERVSKKNIWDAVGLKVTEEQLSFVESAPNSLAYALVEKHERCYVAKDCGRAVGLTVLNIDKAKKNYVVSILLVDRRYQGRGYGKFMLRWAVGELIRHGAESLEISVNRSNTVARRLYESVGFRPDKVYDGGVELKLDTKDYKPQE